MILIGIGADLPSSKVASTIFGRSGDIISPAGKHCLRARSLLFIYIYSCLSRSHEVPSIKGSGARKKTRRQLQASRTRESSFSRPLHFFWSHISSSRRIPLAFSQIRQSKRHSGMGRFMRPWSRVRMSKAHAPHYTGKIYCAAPLAREQFLLLLSHLHFSTSSTLLALSSISS